MEDIRRADTAWVEDPLELETLAGGLREFGDVDPLFDDQIRANGVKFCAGLLAALGHPTRLRIAGFLRKGPQTVSGISTELGISQANASQHLAVLMRAGALVKQSEGTARKYSLREPGLAKLLDRIEEYWHTHREDLVEERLG